MDQKPLEGISVIEFGDSEAAGACTLMLSDFGANVIKLMPLDTEKGECATGEFKVSDRGKKRFYFDQKEDIDRVLFLIGMADAVVDGCGPGKLEKIGITEKVLKEWNPGLIYASVTGYGTKGPLSERPYSEAAVQAESGFVSTTGPEGGDPVRCGGDIATFTGGMTTCIAVLMALIDKMENNRGRFMDISMMDSLVYGLENQLSLSIKTGVVPKPKGNNYALSAPVGNFPCKDGEIMISVATEAQFAAFAQVLGREDWLEKLEYCNVTRRIQNYRMLGKEVSEVFSQYTCKELMELLQTRSCIYGKINTFDAVVAHPQVAARGMIIEAEDPYGNPFKMPGNPVIVNGKHMEKKKIFPAERLEKAKGI